MSREQTWESRKLLPINEVLDTNFDLRDFVQDVKLGNVQSVEPVDHT